MGVAPTIIKPCPGCGFHLRFYRGHREVIHVACQTTIPADEVQPDELDPPGYTPSLFD